MPIIQTEGIYESVLRIYHGEDLVIALPQFVDPATISADFTSGTPFDITDVDIEIIIRPSFDHDTRFRLLTSVGANGIRKEMAAQGLAIIDLAQTAVESTIPVSPSQGWAQFMTLAWTDPVMGPLKKLYARGPCYVYPNNDLPTGG
jgi:hypothetical protein